MSVPEDLVANVKGWWQGLGYDVSVDWEDRDQPMVGTSRVLAHVLSTSEVALGGNSSIRLVEIELTVARRRAPLETYAAVRATMHSAMIQAASVSAWVALSSVRASPLPDVEPSRNLEKVAGVLVFAVRANVALEA